MLLPFIVNDGARVWSGVKRDIAFCESWWINLAFDLNNLEAASIRGRHIGAMKDMTLVRLYAQVCSTQKRFTHWLSGRPLKFFGQVAYYQTDNVDTTFISYAVTIAVSRLISTVLIHSISSLVVYYYYLGVNATVHILEPVWPPNENVGYLTWEEYSKSSVRDGKVNIQT